MLLLSALSLLTVTYALGAKVTSDPSSIANNTFSYIIVGGGTAGLALAHRLAEVPEWSILVIEAGPNTQNNSAATDPGLCVFSRNSRLLVSFDTDMHVVQLLRVSTWSGYTRRVYSAVGRFLLSHSESRSQTK